MEQAAHNDLIHTITDETFESFIKDPAHGAVLLDIWAPWCGPCKAMEPVLAAVAAAYKDRGVAVGKLDADQNHKVLSDYGIQSIPTLLFFKSGRIRERIVGATKKEVIQSALDAVLNAKTLLE